jgi:hypothetical protein
MSAKAQHSRKAHQHYLVQFTIEADGRTPDDAIQDALDQILHDGLQSAQARIEEIPPHGSPLTVNHAEPLGDIQLTSSGPVARSSRDAFHGLFLG